MIATGQHAGISANLWRPDIFSDEDVIKWKRIHEFIETSPQKIWVNGAYHFVSSVLAENGRYGGGGMKYMFWFESESDKDIFLAAIDEIRFDVKSKL